MKVGWVGFSRSRKKLINAGAKPAHAASCGLVNSRSERIATFLASPGKRLGANSFPEGKLPVASLLSHIGFLPAA